MSNSGAEELKLIDLEQSTSEVITNEITAKWRQIQNLDGTFLYKLNVREEKVLAGQYKFLCQFNPERTSLRRAPDSIASLHPVFDINRFHFNKVKSKELVLKLKLEHNIFTMIINNSPLTLYHCVICPRIDDNLPQVLTEEAIHFGVKLLETLDDKSFKIGYNSPGALASVNHLHIQLIHVEHRLYVDDVELMPIASNVFETTEEHPIKALCFLFPSTMTSQDKKLLVQRMKKLIDFLCQEKIPHNLFWIKCDNPEGVKVFLFSRENASKVKDYSVLNVAFCEFSGYFPVGGKKK